jgi:hypothetical protein
MFGQKSMCKKVEPMKFTFFTGCANYAIYCFWSDRLEIVVPHYFNTEENLNYVGPIPGVSYYGVKEMSDAERTEVVEWYEGQKSKIFDNMHVHESYCQDDVNVLRQACHVLTHEIIRVGYIEVFLEAVTIAPA